MSALVLLAPGAEEMETVIIVDVLRRGDIQVIQIMKRTCDISCDRSFRFNI